MSSRQLVDASKFLSYVLRHEPQTIGLTLDSEGWGSLEQVIAGSAQHGQPLNLALIQQVVSTSDKKRFEITSDGLRIRAVQGHSTRSVERAFDAKVPPQWLFHGTAARFLDAIQSEGLKPGERHYVHLSADEETARAVGQRYGSPVVLTINAALMHAQGHVFYQAENGVWLTDAVPVLYFNRFT
jgi:putative RNA 2'-phosphotransferase